MAGIIMFLLLLALSQHPGDPTRIQRGDSDKRVFALLGQPDATNLSPRYLSWGTPIVRHANTGQCVKEFTYIRKDAKGKVVWCVGFDAESRVVSNYRETHPGFPRAGPL